MTPGRNLLALGALGSAIALSGCAAAVIPLTAGTLMATSARTNGGTGTNDALAGQVALSAAVPQPSQVISVVPGALPAPTARLAAETANGESLSAELLPLPTRTSNGPTVMRGPLPPPSTGNNFTVEGFLAHALEQAGRNPTLTPRQSALLAEPGLLQPERMDCGSKPPAVILDLDPGKESFDPLAVVAENLRLGEALAELRARDITVFWTSHLGEGFEEPLRSVLAESGLDPQGQDRLLLLRSLDQRKHTRRIEIAQTHCVVAMMGDERADFDELYHYLKRPETALRLDAMLGSGWFLADPIPAQIVGDE